MIDQKTQNLKLSLPHPDNELKVDVLRLREAFILVDASFQTLRDLVSSDDVNLDTVQEIVNLLKIAQGNIGSITGILSKKANKDDVQMALNELFAEGGKKVNKDLFSSETEKIWNAIQSNFSIANGNSSYARHFLFSF